MKFHISLLIAAATITCCIPSCSLDEKPSTSADMLLETIGDFDSQTRSCYEGLRSGSYYGGTMQMVCDVMSDNLAITTTGLQSYRDIYNFNIQPTSGTVSSVWSVAYNTILQANRVIEPLKDVNKFVNTPDELTSYGLLAEAYAIRAMVHFDLVRLFAPRYTNATAAATTPAIPYVTSTDPKALPGRNTLSEVYQSILADLNTAYTLIGNTGDTHNSTINTRLKQQSVAALLSRVYLTLAADGNDFALLENARLYAKDAVESSAYGTDLLNRDGFYQIWHSTITQANPEVLFRIAILDTDGQTIGNNYGQSSSDGFRNNYEVSSIFYNTVYRSDTTDIRIPAYTRVDSYKGSSYKGVYKYRTRGGTSPVNLCDAVLIRTPEMYLTLAEANARLGNELNALSFLNMVRTRRYTTPQTDTPTGDALLVAILTERRKELAFENERFFDLKRWNMTIESNGEAGRISASDPRTVWPIPQSETEVNPNLR